MATDETGGAAFAMRAAEMGIEAAVADLDEQIAEAIEAAPDAMLALGGTEAEAEAHRDRVAQECALVKATWLAAHTPHLDEPRAPTVLQ